MTISHSDSYQPHQYTWYGGQIGYDVHYNNRYEHYKTMAEAVNRAVVIGGSVWKTTRLLLPLTDWFLERHELIEILGRDRLPEHLLPVPTSRR